MKHLRILSSLAGAIAVLALATACQPDNSASTREAQQTQSMTAQASNSVGMPAMVNYAEKQQLKDIYELRDQKNLVTYTYIVDMQGRRHAVCPTTSVGFGIPYATQYTAPIASKMVRPLYPDGTQINDWHEADLPQPEPNGLHMPGSAAATWVICLAPSVGGKPQTLAPTYVEPEIAVYLFEMPHVD